MSDAEADAGRNAGTASDGTDAERDAAGVRKWPVVGLVLAVLWLFVRGVAPGDTLEATLRTLLGEFLIGLAVGLPTAFALRRYYLPRVSIGRDIRVLPYAALYLVVFVRELLTANLDVAYRVLAPSMPIRPDVIAIPLRVESDAAITTIANSITLTPGTLTMDHDAATNTLYVHALTGGNREAVVEPVRTWEDYALVIFEGRDPNTEVPRDPLEVSTDGRAEPRDGHERVDTGGTPRNGASGDGASPPGEPTDGRGDRGNGKTEPDATEDGGSDPDVTDEGGDGRGR